MSEEASEEVLKEIFLEGSLIHISWNEGGGRNLFLAYKWKVAEAEGKLWKVEWCLSLRGPINGISLRGQERRRGCQWRDGLLEPGSGGKHAGKSIAHGESLQMGDPPKTHKTSHIWNSPRVP